MIKKVFKKHHNHFLILSRKDKEKNNENPPQIGSRKVKKKVTRPWCEKNLLNAIHETHSVPGTSIRSAATKSQRLEGIYYPTTE